MQPVGSRRGLVDNKSGVDDSWQARAVRLPRGWGQRRRRARGASARRRTGSGPGRRGARSARSTVRSWNRTMSTTGARSGRARLAAESRRARRPRRARARAAALALEHEAAHALVDRGEVPVQELLRVVRLRGHGDALAQLQRRLLRGRPVAAGARRQPALVRRPAGSRSARARPRPRPGATDVLAASAAIAATAQRVARGVAPALLDSGAATTTWSQRSAIGPSGFAGDEPLGRAEGPRRLERQGRVALVADEDEQVRRGRFLDEIERLDRRPPPV